jgi:hypothetical protein
MSKSNALFGQVRRCLIFVALTILTQQVSAACVSNRARSEALPNETQYAIEGTCFSDMGWASPLPLDSGKLHTKSNFDFDSQHYIRNNGRTHGGLDLVGKNGAPYNTQTPVYAIGFGKVVYIARNAIRSTDNGDEDHSRLAVLHHTARGLKFLVIYGHVATNASIQVGQYISPGTYLGQIRWAVNYHLHLELRPDEETYTGGTWGIMGNTTDPIAFLANNSAPLIPRSILDGQGTLTNPNLLGGCSSISSWGCSRDQAILHSRPEPSTAVFQVQHFANGTCNHVAISGLQSAYVSVRQWNETYPGERGRSDTKGIFKANTFPALFRLPIGFSLVSVTSVQPVPAGETRTITMECRSTPYQEYSSNPNKVRLDTAALQTRSPNSLLLSLVSDSLDSRNSVMNSAASLISVSGLSGISYGSNIDVLLFTGTKHERNIVQTYNSGTCNLRLVGTNASARYSIYRKRWNATDWQLVSSDVTLPHALNNPASDYTVYMLRQGTPKQDRVTVNCIA